jgi:hypothetical protein
MTRTDDLSASETVAESTYQAPALQYVGPAGTVIMGLPGGGFDGPFGMTDNHFEFEPDDTDGVVE